jgi:hypothetical protein
MGHDARVTIAPVTSIMLRRKALTVLPTRRVRPRTLLAVAGLLAAACAATTAAPASADLGLSCPDPTFQPFAPWGDSAFYKLAPNGGFEGGATSWTLTGGAQVVAGNEAYAVSGAGVRSLTLPAGSSATTAPMCVSVLSGKMRFFVRNGGASTAQLRVRVLYNGGTGALLGGLSSTLGIADVGTITAGGTWRPSPEITMLGGTLPLFTTSVQFRFQPVGTSGDWRIDDVYVDPLKHR